MEKIPMSNIAELRKQLGMTQRELAIKLGVTESTVRNLENNRNGVDSIIKVINLCRALQCQPEALIKYEELDKVTADD